MSISQHVQQAMKEQSWIRRMFERGQELMARYGKHNVFDFSLGSPMLEPPEAFLSALRYLTNHPTPGLHRYMPNCGFRSTREAVAKYVTAQEQLEVAADDIIMTVGAAGAMNVAMAAILDPGDEVIVLAPYFVEYMFYVSNHNGKVVVVQTSEDFDLDIAAIDAAITARTKAIVLNTPNNPTGRIYTQERLDQLSSVLEQHERRHGHAIYVLADTPYARLTYDGCKNPRLLVEHPNTLLAHSFSKDLGLAGERIGYLAVSPRAIDRSLLLQACTFTNRTLGFVNAPALMQLAVERSLEATVDVAHYARLRDLICSGLREAGYEFTTPQGAFFLFAKSPIPDDVAFTQKLVEENVLTVPGSGFGRAGYLRIAYCVPQETIVGALPRFAKVRDRARGS